MRKLLLVAVASLAMFVAACSPSNGSPGGVDSSPDLGASPEIPLESIPVETFEPSPSAS